MIKDRGKDEAVDEIRREHNKREKERRKEVSAAGPISIIRREKQPPSRCHYVIKLRSRRMSLLTVSQDVAVLPNRDL